MTPSTIVHLACEFVLGLVCAYLQLPRNVSWPIRGLGAIPWMFVWYAVLYVVTHGRW